MKNDMINTVFIKDYVGRQITFYRKRAGLSQSGLAKRIDKSYQQVQHYEYGDNEVTASVLAQIAEVLRIDVGDLFPSSKEPEDILCQLMKMQNSTYNKLKILAEKAKNTK